MVERLSDTRKRSNILEKYGLSLSDPGSSERCLVVELQVLLLIRRPARENLSRDFTSHTLFGLFKTKALQVRLVAQSPHLCENVKDLSTFYWTFGELLGFQNCVQIPLKLVYRNVF